MMERFYCPQCRPKHKLTDVPKSIRIANDGGSTCPDCGVLFHKCVGKVKYGSPGPILCKDCRGLKGQMSRFEPM